jgi:ABC-type branched-subunit amino acid transport system permease subunit
MGNLLNTPLRKLAALAILLALLLPLALPTYYVSVATQILIFSVLAMSVDILAGFTGRTPLCHGAIFGTSTYVVLYTSAVYGMPLPAAMLLGVLAATLLAAVFGLLAVRTSGVYFLLLTLALGLIVWGVCLRRERRARAIARRTRHRAAPALRRRCDRRRDRDFRHVALCALALRADAARHQGR